MEDMTPLDVAKAALAFVVGSGATTIVSAIVKNNVVPKNIYQKMSVPLASMALGALVADKTNEHLSDAIDKYITWLYENNLIQTKP